MSELNEKLSKIQKELKAPKNQYNAFGKYKYRSCEDILEGLKHVLGNLTVTISDDVNVVNDRIYVKATATISNGLDSISTTAFAREPLTKKGMDEAQVTGSASSYARKYALNGLFLIDDSKDADSMKPEEPKKKIDTSKEEKLLKDCKDIESLGNVFKSLPKDKQVLLGKLTTNLKLELSK